MSRQTTPTHYLQQHMTPCVRRIHVHDHMPRRTGLLLFPWLMFRTVAHFISPKQEFRKQHKRCLTKKVDGDFPITCCHIRRSHFPVVGGNLRGNQSKARSLPFSLAQRALHNHTHARTLTFRAAASPPIPSSSRRRLACAKTWSPTCSKQRILPQTESFRNAVRALLSWIQFLFVSMGAKQ